MRNRFHIAGCLRLLITAGGLLWPVTLPLYAQAGSDSAGVTLSLPHLAIPAGTDTVVVPLELRNDWNEVGGLQVDISCGDSAPRDILTGQVAQLVSLSLDTILTTGRTPGWRIDRLQLPETGISRILLFDPAGANIAVGTGPVLELVISIPEEGLIPDLVPIRMEAHVVSDPVGGALPVRAEDGSLRLGEVVELKVGAGEADHGETVSLAVDLLNAGQVVGVQFHLAWESHLLELVEVATTERASRFQLEWEVSDDSPPVPQEFPGVGGWVWLYSQSGKELEAGQGPILTLVFEIANQVYAADAMVRPLDAQVMGISGRERTISRTVPGLVKIFPGYLDPPRNLVALSGQDGQVPLSWAPPTGEEAGAEALLLVDDDASQLGPPFIDVGGQMADDLTAADYAFDYFVVPLGSDGPGPEALRHVHTVIWMTGYEWGYHPTLTPDDQANLADFLMGGGRVWLIGQDIIWDIGDSFVRAYFGARAVTEDAGTPETLIGAAGNILAGIEYPATAPSSGMDYGDAITTSNEKARRLVAGLTHLGAVGQDRTAFWALEYGFILARMDRIDGIRHQLTAFGLASTSEPGIGRVLSSESGSRYAPRGPSPIKAEALSQGYSSVTDSLIRLPAVVHPDRDQILPLVGYSIYRGHELPVPRHPDAQVATVAPDVLSFTDTTVSNGQRYTYVTTARYGQQFESGTSNEVQAATTSWVDFALGKVAVMAGDQVAIPVWIENDDPVSGIRFEIRDIPSGHLSRPRAVLGSHAPPDWVISLEQDTVSGSLSFVSFSPRLTAIPPGKGEVLLLLMDADAAVPITIPLEADRVVISDDHGDAYQTRVTGGSIHIGIQLVRFMISTGAPTQPGDTGYVSIFMDNPRPVAAFQLVIRPASDALQVVDVQGGLRLPIDANVAHSDLGGGALRLIGSSFSGIPIAAGRGPVATIAYHVSPDALEGLVGLDLEEVVLSGEPGITLRQATVSGSFPVGEVRAVFAPVGGEGEPGRTVTVPLGLANSVDLCGFQVTIAFDPRYLTFRSFEVLDRIPAPGALFIEPGDSSAEGAPPDGEMLLRCTPDDGNPILAGTGPLLNLIYFLDHQVPTDTALILTANRVSALGCEEQLVFAVGQEGEIAVGKLPQGPEHFTVDIEPTGITHFIQVQAATLGGVYLSAGDELAVIDTAGWTGPEGRLGRLVVGSGVVQSDGTANITAVMGFEPDPGGLAEDSRLNVLPGARTGGSIHFQAWDRETGREGKAGTDARYILGAGVWGENNGLTIVEIVRVPEQVRPVPELFPDKLEVASNDPNPFSTTTTIRFGLPGDTEVKVTVFDLMGREVATLHDGITAAGYHEVQWNGTDDDGKAARNGMYFLQVRTPDGTVTRKMLLMR